MSKLRRSSMREQCYEIIKEKIFRQAYDLGEDINIVALSNELSVSNTPVREALSRLEADGLVESSFNMKTKVISFNEHNFHEMVQTVTILLDGAYEHCIAENKVALLGYLLSQSLKKQQACLVAKDFYRFIFETLAFDRCFLDALGNTRLISVFDSLSNVLFLMFRANHQKDSNQRELCIAEHQKILEAVEKNAHDEVRGLLTRHFDKKLNF